MAKFRIAPPLYYSIAFRRLAVVTLFALAVLCGSLLWGQSSPWPLQHGTSPPPPQSLPLPQAPPELLQAPPEAPTELPGQENVVKVVIQGNQTIPVQKILSSIRTRAGRPLDIETVREDIHRLIRTRLFVDVKPYSRKVPGGQIVIFDVFERPLIREIKFIGNTKIKSKTLAKEIDIKVGDAVNPYTVSQGRRKIEEFYQDRGFSKVRVQVFEGNKPQDRRVVYLINEGHKQKVLWTRFIGNTIADDARLRTQIESKPPMFYIFKGEVNREEIDRDVDRLTTYYRGLGFLKAKIGRELKFVADDNWLILTFVINEGPRFVVERILFEGNMKYSDEDLAHQLKLKPGQFFNQSSLLRDKADIQDKYGSVGYIFSDVNIESRMYEGEGKVDLVYGISEGDRYRVGDINVDIEGEYPHTMVTTILNRLSLKPGDIVDVRELRASERRLRASGLFLVDPKQGIAPKIVFSPPQFNDFETEAVRRPPGKIRGQSPDAPVSPNGDRRVHFMIRGRVLPQSRQPPRAQPDSHTGPYYPGFRPREQRVVRGQSIDGRAVPSLPPRNQGYAPSTTYTGQPDASYPRVAAAPTPAPPLMPGRGVLSPESPSFDDSMETETTRPLPLGVVVNEAPTGRFMFGVGVNSDAGLVGSAVIDERNFDLFRPPRSWRDIVNATAWRGAGQTLRIEAVPGTEVQRYMINFQEPYLLNTYVALGLSGYFYDRRYFEWDEQRAGGRVSLGYQFRPDLSGSLAFRGARVNIHDVVAPTLPELAEVLGDNTLYGFSARLAHDTRDNAFLPTSGHLIELSCEQVTGTWTYSRGEVDVRKYFLLHERADGSGRHVVGVSARMGVTGSDTPIYDRYFIGGFSTLRGFDFREASPRRNGILVGGDFLMLAKIQYMFPVTADDMLHAVVFCDTGTVEPTIDDWSNKYRVAPGVGLRVTVPAMGPAPIALDFAFPVSTNPGDREEMFSFFVGFNH